MSRKPSFDAVVPLLAILLVVLCVSLPAEFVPPTQLRPYAPPPASARPQLPIRPYFPVKANASAEERWVTILGNYPPDARQEPALKARINQEFLSVNTSSMPPEWRAVFLEKRLFGMQTQGDWEGMLKVLSELMAPKESDPRRSPLDADLLYQAAGYFDRVVFFPPGGAKMSIQDEMAYWQKHYRNVGKAKEIYQYVVDRFDPYYLWTVESLSSLAGCQAQLDETTASLASLARLASIRIERVFAVNHRDTNGRLIPASEARRQSIPLIQNTLERLPERRVEQAELLPLVQDERELKRLQEEYRNDTETQRNIKEALTRLAER